MRSNATRPTAPATTASARTSGWRGRPPRGPRPARCSARHNLELVLTSLVNGVTYGLLLFMLSSGLTLIFSMMGVLNFAHASFYMLGAYFGYVVSARVG